MITFITGLVILLLGYIFYGNYVTNQFTPDDRKTPALEINDGIDYIKLPISKNMLIQLLNIAGMGPIIGAIQGILFGPIAFILIPLGCVFMGAVHDYFCGMISLRNKGLQLTGLIEKYLGKKSYYIFMALICFSLILVSVVFVYTSGDLFAEKFLKQTDFSLHNPVILAIYGIIAFYYILATLFPIDKIIGRFYPFLSFLLIAATAMILCEFVIKGVNLTNIDFSNINLHPKNLPILPMFFMTVSCGLLSGFHATQSTIISRTLGSEYDGKKVFYGMMCLESLIAMIWAAGAMDVYNSSLVADNFIGTIHVVNTITDKFIPHILTFLVTIAVIILPITSGDTALRGLRMIIADALKIDQVKIKNRLFVSSFIIAILIFVLYMAKNHAESFFVVWRYFTFINQLIAIPTFIYATIFLKNQNKNYYITLLPGLFYIFITMTFILYNNIGFNLNINISKYLGLIITFISLICIYKFKLKNNKII